MTDPILRTEKLTVRFGGLTALNNVDFAVPRGEIRAIIGPNGAGKSTFFNCLTGVLRPTAGRIRLNGEDITGLSSDRISRKGIARSYQITNILPNATTLENVRIAAQSRRHSWSMLTHYSAFTDVIAKAEAAEFKLAPFLGVGCPGKIESDGAIANALTVGLGTGGRVTIFADAAVAPGSPAAQVILDVAAYVL